MVGYKAKREMVRTRRSYRQIKKQFDRFASIAKKENVKNRFFSEYKAYQEFDRKITRLEGDIAGGKAEVTQTIADEINGMDVLEETRLLADYETVKDDLSASRKKFEKLFLAAYAVTCLDAASEVARAMRGNFSDTLANHPWGIAAFGAITALTVLLFKAVQRYYKAAERMQGIAAKHSILGYGEHKGQNGICIKQPSG